MGSDIKIEFNQDAMDEIANSAMDDALERGIEVDCTVCGNTFTLSNEQLQCPHCGVEYRPKHL